MAVCLAYPFHTMLAGAVAAESGMLACEDAYFEFTHDICCCPAFVILRQLG